MWNTAQLYPVILSQLNEKQQRLYVASEALRLGYGGISQVSRESGISRVTITAGIVQLKSGIVSDGRIRKPGGGRKPLTFRQTKLAADICRVADPKGNPESPIRWTSYSLKHMAGVLQKKGYTISPMSVHRILKTQGFSLKANKKKIEGKGANHPDRNLQFEQMRKWAETVIANQSPVISIDCKKKELVGNFKNHGREWLPYGKDTPVNVYDYSSLSDGKAVPYGVYDLVHNQGFVNVGVNHDTAKFAVESIRRWWHYFGKQAYPQSSILMITADGGGSNGSRNRLFKIELQQLANEIKLPIRVSHYPPYTSKWNAIEHKLFSFISINWRAKPLVSFETIIELLNHTTTQQGLRVTAVLDQNRYWPGIKITDQDLQRVNLQGEDFHPEWNYVISPNL